MAHLGIAIDQKTNDWFLEPDGTLSMVQDAEAVGQHARNRVKLFYGEWFLDTECGVPWLDEIMGKAYDPALNESILKAEIINTDGVTEITSFSSDFERRTRELRSFNVRVWTEYDQEIII